MIVELRTYAFEAGAMPAFLAAYRSGPDQLQAAILGERVGYYSVETGDVNRLIHLWRYDSFEERQRRRAELARHPDWVAFLREALPLIKSQESTLLSEVALPASNRATDRVRA